MDLANSVSGIEKLSTTNYDYWKSCIESYLQGKDLWEIVSGTETTPPTDTPKATRKWKIKAGKALFVLKPTIQKELLEHTQ